MQTLLRGGRFTLMRGPSLGRYRAALVGGCALTLVVAVAAIWAATRPRVPDPASLPLPAPRFVAADGTTYTRVAVAYLDTSKSSSVEVNIPPGRTPLSVFPACALARPRSDDMSGIMVGSAAANSSFACRSRSPFGLEVADLDRSALTAGGRLRFKQADTLADTPATAPAAWAFAVYAWTIPARLAPAPAAPPAAPTLTEPGTTPRRLTLVHQYHGVWPVQRTVRISVPEGRGFIVAFACTSAIAGKTISFVRANQQLVDTGSVTCAGPGGSPINSYAHLYTDQPATATITLNFDPILDRRGGSWTVAVYGR
jgi:hypothetical protein